MKKNLPWLVLLILMGCGREFEPDIKGWQAYTLPGSRRVQLILNGKESTITLPGDQSVTYRFAQWTKTQDRILLAQIIKTTQCQDYRILAIDTAGIIQDTIYTAPPNTPTNFKLAPNDSLLLLKTYYDNCEEAGDFKYTFYNRYLKRSLPDTIIVGNARGILIPETVWSPDSKKVILTEKSGPVVKAFVYDLVTKSKTEIGKGSSFKWSPIDTNRVAYIQDYSIYTKNMETGETEIIFTGKKKRGATDFRWSPEGDYVMIHIQGYLLNVDVPPLQSHRIMYLSLPNKIESHVYYDDQHIDTWKMNPSDTIR